jgi:misacylated tRNA(Ala) deacylase
VPASPASLPAAGMAVKAEIDWERRHRHMRMHTALHLLCSLIPFPVTGGSIGAEESRLDFDISDADAVDKDDLTARLNALVASNHAVTSRWISDAELADNPGLVRTMSVKPPVGSGRVRLVAIGPDGAVDLQPCGGTHVRFTGEIGAVAVTKIEKKGRQNRRIRLAFADRA